MNPHAPRPIDLPTTVPLEPGADLTVLDEAKIFAAPDDPAHWAHWREQLHRWRDEEKERLAYDGSRYGAGVTRSPSIGFRVACDLGEEP